MLSWCFLAERKHAMDILDENYAESTPESTSSKSKISPWIYLILLALIAGWLSFGGGSKTIQQQIAKSTNVNASA